MTGWVIILGLVGIVGIGPVVIALLWVWCFPRGK